MCVLVVEDEPITRMVAEASLGDAGHEVVSVPDAHAAVDAVAAQPCHFSCLVTDYHMPGTMTGAHLVEHMRQPYPDIPMILATGSPEATTPKWRAHHRVDVLEKPYSPAALVKMVARRIREMVLRG